MKTPKTTEGASRLKLEIDHIFNSGANEIRILELCNRVTEQARREERTIMMHKYMLLVELADYIISNASFEPLEDMATKALAAAGYEGKESE